VTKLTPRACGPPQGTQRVRSSLIDGPRRRRPTRRHGRGRDGADHRIHRRDPRTRGLYQDGRGPVGSLAHGSERVTLRRPVDCSSRVLSPRAPQAVSPNRAQIPAARRPHPTDPTEHVSWPRMPPTRAPPARVPSPRRCARSGYRATPLAQSAACRLGPSGPGTACSRLSSTLARIWRD
jgi:hypothetical protein